MARIPEPKDDHCVGSVRLVFAEDLHHDRRHGRLPGDARGHVQIGRDQGRDDRLLRIAVAESQRHLLQHPTGARRGRVTAGGSTTMSTRESRRRHAGFRGSISLQAARRNCLSVRRTASAPLEDQAHDCRHGPGRRGGIPQYDHCRHHRQTGRVRPVRYSALLDRSNGQRRRPGGLRRNADTQFRGPICGG
ncbi:hypothetical protein NSERUTF1_7706 [Nocardia seriolae]|nr:hypothetical protein NSERUTF1_7706 [Nocardia seriolae]